MTQGILNKVDGEVVGLLGIPVAEVIAEQEAVLPGGSTGCDSFGCPPSCY